MNCTLIQKVSKNPHVQAAAIAMLSVNMRHAEVTDEYGEEAGQVLTRCCSLMGLPSDARKLTPKQQVLDDIVTEAVQQMTDKMERALVAARLLSRRN